VPGQAEQGARWDREKRRPAIGYGILSVLLSVGMFRRWVLFQGEFIWDFVDMIPRRQSDFMIDMVMGSEWALGLHSWAYVSWPFEY
jgi:hypothetical protein